MVKPFLLSVFAYIMLFKLPFLGAVSAFLIGSLYLFVGTLPTLFLLIFCRFNRYLYVWGLLFSISSECMELGGFFMIYI